MKRFWKNWLGNQTARAYYHAPRSLEQLRSVVREAAKKGRIRAVGNSFAWSKLVPTSDTLVSLKHLNRLLDVNHTESTVTIECGMAMKQLTRVTEAYGFTLVSPTIFPRVAIGGALATGSHGTGKNVQTFSDNVVAATVVNANGDVVEIKQSDGDLLDAARVAMGTFGVMYSVTLKVQKTFNVRVEVKTFPEREVLEHIPDILKTYEYVEMYWFPYTKIMWLMAADATTENSDRFGVRWFLRRGIMDALTLAGGTVAMPVISNFFPRLTPLAVNLSQYFAFRQGEAVEPAAIEFHYQTAYPKIWDMSLAVPTTHAKQSWELIMDLVDRYRANGKYPVNFVAHARYIGASTGLICPAMGRETTPIEVVTGWLTPGIDEFYGDLEAEFYQRIPDSRPHWGKFITRPDRIHEQYPPQAWQRFLQLRESFDPERVFLNHFLEHKVFKLPALNGSSPPIPQ